MILLLLIQYSVLLLLCRNFVIDLCLFFCSVVLSVLSSFAITVNSEIFARVLLSRNFAHAKFRVNKILAKW